MSIRVNLSSTPHPQPLSHAGERGARASDPPSPVQQKRSILCPPPCQKSEASSVLPPLVGGNEGGRGERGG
ncbi:hypothetical protein MC7420_6960 [Coleofasciculus chthonoplastes PCC 7420]|uniref:Uncharacterized protein n=1 Tax=Coleofasciculus chthonoplastes PCC 7420 TaxID=118168 RepID=B4W205_9CYAN|nr:hypothetical protein MC7420_6960 [Coleofasciculus chthonoplastes PCC 7420]